MITISSGHWTVGTGAVGIVDEVTESRKVAKRVVEILRSNNVVTNYVEDNVSKNKSQNLSFHVKQHNLSNRQLDVSIHFNSTSGTETRGIGTETLYYSEKTLASKISKAISEASGLIDRGAKERKDLAILSGTNKPAVLIEVCFVNSTVDVALYRRDFEKICQAIANVLMEHVGKNGPSDSGPGSINDRTSLVLLTDTGRSEIRQLLKSARKKEIISKEHTDEKISGYTDIQLLSYLSAVVNRTFK